MRHLKIISGFIFIGLLSFNKQVDSGKKLFENNCSSCHSANNILTGPPFQNIRNDYGLTWTIKFIKDNQVLIKQKDTKALYIYYSYNELLQTRFPNLSNTDIIKILDYVDTFPVDTLQYQYRHLSETGTTKIYPAV